METGENKMFAEDRKIEALSEAEIKKKLGEQSFFGELLVFPELDSTNRYLKEQAVKGATEGTVVFAERQSAGRGRLGRSFFSPDGKGIYMSVLLRPNIELQKSVRITSMAAVAVALAIERVCHVPAQIKWVNDIFLHGKKVCGILTEAGIDYEKGILEYVVLGIGINVGKIEFPKELGKIATSLENEAGKEISRNTLAAEVLKELVYWYPSLWDGSFLKESKERSILLGKEILVADSAEKEGFYKAKAMDLDDMGHLLVERDGTQQLLCSGEVSIRF